LGSASTPAGTPPASGPFKRRGHILVVLFAVLVVVGVVPMIALAWKLIAFNRETLITAQQQIQVERVRSAALEVDLRMRAATAELTRVAATLGALVERQPPASRDEIERVLGAFRVEPTRHLRYTYPDGSRLGAVRSGDCPPGLEAAADAAFRAALEAHLERAAGGTAAPPRPARPVLLPEDPGRAWTLITAPVATRRALHGAITAVIDLRPVWDAVLGQIKDHQVFAVDETGRVFATSDPQRLPAGADLHDSPLVRPFLARRQRESVIFQVARPAGEQTYFGASEPTSQDWGIFVQAPARDVGWTVRDMERTALHWVVALIGLAGLAAIVLARSLSNPINRLVAAAADLARGNLATRVVVRSRNEIGELGHAFNTMAAEIGTAIERLREARDKYSELFLGTIQALAEAIDAKDPYTRGHSVRVNRYSVIIARFMGIEGAELHDIHVSSLLHDVGKIAIDDAILKKASPLTPQEFEIIKTHTVRGAAIMAPIRPMQSILPGLRHHHERCDGSGYPDGLARAQTPLMARIIAVADTFDAITTDRPYQRGMGFERAVARINELKGPALDPAVVEAFNRACVAEEIRLEVEPEAAPAGA